MGNKIKIDEIKSQALRNVADAANTEHVKKGNLKGKEIVVFQQMAKQQGLVSEAANENDYIKELLGYTPSAQAKEEAAQTVVEPKDEKPFQGTFSPEEVQNAQKEAETAAQSLTEEESTAAAEKGTDVKTEEVQTKKVERSIQINGSTSLGDAKFNQLLIEYTNLRSKGMRPKAAYEAVKENHKSEKKDKATKKTYQAALKQLKAYAKNVDAQLNAMDAVHQSDATKPKQVKADAKAFLASENGGKIDSWDKRAINGNKRNVLNWISGQDSAMKELRRAQAYGNNAAKIKNEGVTIQQLEKTLSKKSPYLKMIKDGTFEKAGLVKRNGNTYDISMLSDFVQNYGTGSEHTLSRQQNKPVAEVANLRAELSTKVPELKGVKVKDKYVKQLVELTGRHVERKNIIKNGYNNIIGGTVAGIGGAAISSIVKLKVFQHAIAKVNLEFNSGQYSALQNDASFQELINKMKQSLNVSAEAIQNYESGWFDSGLINMLKGAGVGAAIGLLGSALSYGRSEKEVIPNITDCKTFDEFVAKIETMVANGDIKPLYGEIAELIAYSFKNEDGSLDCCAMNEFLGYNAGNGSRLNRAELMKALEERKAYLEKQPIKEEKVDDKKDEEEECDDCDAKQTVIPDKEINVPTTEFRAWQDIANGYRCLDKPEYTKYKFKSGATLANRMSKVIQAISIEDVQSNDDLKERFNIKTIAEFTKEAAKSGIDAAIAKYPQLHINKEEYLEVLSAKGGVKGTVNVPALYDPDAVSENDDGWCSWEKNGEVAIRRGGTGTATVGAQKRTINGKVIYEIKCPETGNQWQECSAEKYNEVVARKAAKKK